MSVCSLSFFFSFTVRKGMFKTFFPAKTNHQQQFLQMKSYSVPHILSFLLITLKHYNAPDPPQKNKSTFSGFLLCPSLSSAHNSLSQNNNNKLSDSARWPALTPEETESHSSTPTDNPLCEASLPLLEQCSHLQQSGHQRWAGNGRKDGSEGPGNRLQQVQRWEWFLKDTRGFRKTVWMPETFYGHNWHFPPLFKI